jgi:osmotically inducible protein OsmC
MAARKGSAEWQGDLKGGSGTVTVGDGVFTGNYSFASRFEDGDGTNPEELLAAAHAGCYTMALTALLGAHDHAPESISTVANVTLRNIDGLPTISKIELVTEGKVPGIDQDHFESHAVEAKDSCVLSRALASVDEVTVEAKLLS